MQKTRRRLPYLQVQQHKWICCCYTRFTVDFWIVFWPNIAKPPHANNVYIVPDEWERERERK